MLPSIHEWDDGSNLLSEHNFVIFSRKSKQDDADTTTPEEKIREHPNFPKNNDTILVPANQSMVGMISSTEVRRRIGLKSGDGQVGMGVSGLVTPSVIDIIKKNKFYHK